MRLQLDPSQTLQELAELSGRLLRGGELLRSVKDDDVAVGTTPKDEVLRIDKTTLYHHRPLAARTVDVPVLVVYGLVGRYTMADLQEDRSLIRNLLGQGVDLYAVDWGNPTRADRWLTLDDYVDEYLASCVQHICAAHKVDRITLLGICEGGVFTVCYAALHPERVRNLIVTITPIDFHADAEDGRPEHGFINLWTRSLTREDLDRLIEANGNLPGELMSFVFSSMTPLASLTKYNLGMLDVLDD
jgi:polyhydroxyalkanoate synthase